MITSKSKAIDRRGVLVSGYYGFDNLGDEAILEQIVAELKRLVPEDEITVLSFNPKKTAGRFQVQSISRTDIGALIGKLRRCRLFLSGGGGLFQNSRSLGSILFYGSQMLLARLAGARVMVYAQGIGPLHGVLARQLTRRFFELADSVTVRDEASSRLLEAWGVACRRTADPVWCLAPGKLPGPVAAQLAGAMSPVALSLRPSRDLTAEHLATLSKALHRTLPAGSLLVLLPLKKEQDEPVLRRFAALWEARQGRSLLLDTSSMELPSQWLDLMGKFRYLVGMRLHALLMAIKQGVPVTGIAYDPKVVELLAECQQPILNLANPPDPLYWTETLKTGFSSQDRLRDLAVSRAETAKNLACQNFAALARILELDGES